MIREEIALMHIATEPAPHSHRRSSGSWVCAPITCHDQLDQFHTSHFANGPAQSTTVRWASFNWAKKGNFCTRRKYVSKQIELNRWMFPQTMPFDWNPQYRRETPRNMLTRKQFQLSLCSLQRLRSGMSRFIVDGISWIDASSKIQFISNSGDRRRVPRKLLSKVFAFISGIEWKRRQRDDDMESVSVSSSTASRLLSFEWRTELSTRECDWIECAAQPESVETRAKRLNIRLIFVAQCRRSPFKMSKTRCLRMNTRIINTFCFCLAYRVGFCLLLLYELHHEIDIVECAVWPHLAHRRLSSNFDCHINDKCRFLGIRFRPLWHSAIK